MEKFKGKDTTKLLQTLKQCVGRNSGPGLSPELRELIGFLKSQRLRHRSDAHAFCASGQGMRILQELVRDCESGQDSRDLVLVLGTIGNLCALGTEARQTVEKNSLEKTIGYLDSHSSPEVVCTVIRVLANLALDHTHNHTLQELGVVNKLSQLLSQSDYDLSCKISITRALRILCTSQDCRDELKWNKGVEALVEALRSDNDDLASGAVQALEVVSVDDDILCCLGNKDMMQHVVKFCSHNKAKVKRSAQSVLLNAARLAESRRSLSSAGGIETLVALMDQPAALQHKGHQVSVRRVVCALCMCCRDAMSRQRLRDCGGLEKMIAMLADEGHAHLHGSIMGALVAFYFDEITLKQMVTKMKLLRALNYHLQILSKKKREEFEKECELNDDNDEESNKSNRHLHDEKEEEREKVSLNMGLSLMQVGCEIGKGSSHSDISMEVSGLSGVEENEVESMLVEEEAGPTSATSSTSNIQAETSTKRKLALDCVNEESTPPLSKHPRQSFHDGSSSLSTHTNTIVTGATTPIVTGATTPTGATPSRATLRYTTCTSATPSSSAPTSIISTSITPMSSNAIPIDAAPTSTSANRTDVTPISISATPISSGATPTSTDATPPSLLDSLLSSPSPFTASQSAVVSSPWTPTGGRGLGEVRSRLEGHVVMMISRISHIRDCLHTLSYPDTLTTLMDYLTSDPSCPSEYIFRVLSRVMANAHCFQNCVVVCMPSRMQTCLRKPYLQPHPSPYPQPHPSPYPQPHPSPYSSSSILSTSLEFCQQVTVDGRLKFMLLELLIAMGKNADCAYGQGVLEHLYLTGGERERHASCLAATLLCKTPRIAD